MMYTNYPDTPVSASMALLQSSVYPSITTSESKLLVTDSELLLLLILADHFYRAMHYSAKRGIAIACRLSVRPSVCLSVRDVGGL